MRSKVVVAASRDSTAVIWSAAWPLVIPVAFFVNYSRYLRIVARTTPVVYPLMVRLTVRATFSVLIVSFGAGLTVCGIVRLRKLQPHLSQG